MSKENETTAPTQAAAKTNKKPMVYCGPSIPGGPKQYTVFYGDVPQAITVLAKTAPAIMALYAPVSNLAAMRTALQTAGSAESVIFASVQKMI